MSSQTATYEAYYYSPDGDISEITGKIIETGSLDDCRAAIRRVLGVANLHGRRWDGLPDEGDVEAYHEYPASHPDAEGCGGYAVRTVAYAR